MTLGILKSGAGERHYAWKALGYVPNSFKKTYKGQFFLESGHTGSAMEKDRIASGDQQEEEKVYMEEEDGDLVEQLQDWHKCYLLLWKNPDSRTS